MPQTWDMTHGTWCVSPWLAPGRAGQASSQFNIIDDKNWAASNEYLHPRDGEHVGEHRQVQDEVIVVPIVSVPVVNGAGCSTRFQTEPSLECKLQYLIIEKM